MFQNWKSYNLAVDMSKGKLMFRP